MKRKDVVIGIKNFLGSHHPITFEDHEYLADSLLRELEEIYKMQPPEREVKMETKMGTWYYHANEWEHEDET